MKNIDHESSCCQIEIVKSYCILKPAQVCLLTIMLRWYDEKDVVSTLNVMPENH